MDYNIQKNNIHKSFDSSKVHILEPITEEDLIGSKESWVWLRFTLPIKLRDWLDDHKKRTGVSYSEYLRKALVDRERTKDIFIKLATKQVLDQKDYLFIDRMINEKY